MTAHQSIISQNIQKRMQDLGIRNKVELSEKSGVSRTVVTNIINMPNKGVMIDTAIKLANALECRVEWLGTGKGPMNDDYIERKFLIADGVPLLNLNEVTGLDDTKKNLDNLNQDSSIDRIPCPSGNKQYAFAVNLNSVSRRANLGKYDRAGFLFFDCDEEPLSGQLVIAQLDENTKPEIMEYVSVQGRRFLTSIEMNIPEQLQSIEITDSKKIVATKVGYAIIE